MSYVQHMLRLEVTLVPELANTYLFTRYHENRDNYVFQRSL